MGNSEQSLRGLWDNHKMPDVCFCEVSEGEERVGLEGVVESMHEDFPNWAKVKT